MIRIEELKFEHEEQMEIFRGNGNGNGNRDLYSLWWKAEAQ